MTKDMYMKFETEIPKQTWVKVTSLKINRLQPIYTSIVPLKFGVDIQSQTKVRVWEQKNPIWPPGGHLKVTSLKINMLLPMTTINMHMKFEIEIPKQTWLTLWKSCHLQSPETEKSKMAATMLKINRLLPIYISIVLLKFKVAIQSQSKVRVRKPKNPIWPPGGNFESDVAENQSASAYGHHQYAYEIWNWNSKGHLTFAPETMSSTDRQTDGRTDGRTRWIQYTPLQLLWAGV